MVENKEIEKRKYEIGFVIKTEDASVISQSLKNRGFVVLTENPLEKIQLAYPIKKESFAYFGYIHFEGEPKAIKDLRLALKLNPEILRYLIITPPFVKKAVKKYEPAKSEEKLSVLPESVLTNEALEKKIKELV